MDNLNNTLTQLQAKLLRAVQKQVKATNVTVSIATGNTKVNSLVHLHIYTADGYLELLSLRGTQKQMIQQVANKLQHLNKEGNKHV